MKTFIMAMLGRMLGGLLENTGKKAWNKYFNNPESVLYYGTIVKRTKFYASTLLLLAGLKFYIFLFRLGIGRKMAKETQEKLVVLFVLITIVPVGIYFYREWKRKKMEAEPILF